MAEANILDIQQVTKRYKNVVAVDDISLRIPQAVIFGLLGPNGAGKTTLIRIITQIIGPDSGTIVFDGEKLQPGHTAHIGYMPEERGLYKKMKVGEQLQYLAQLKNLSSKEAKARVIEWLARFDIEDWRHKKVTDLSKGMQQKVQFIATVLHQPKLLILDEPFSGLDPVNAALLRKEIYRMVNELEISVIFSTHRMEQVEEICENIALIDKGECILDGKVDAIKQQFKKGIYTLKYSGEYPENAAPDYTVIEQHDHTVTFKIRNEQFSNNLLKQLIDSDIHIIEFNEVLPTMNEIFIDQVMEKKAGE